MKTTTNARDKPIRKRGRGTNWNPARTTGEQLSQVSLGGSEAAQVPTTALISPYRLLNTCTFHRPPPCCVFSPIKIETDMRSKALAFSSADDTVAPGGPAKNDGLKRDAGLKLAADFVPVEAPGAPGVTAGNTVSLEFYRYPFFTLGIYSISRGAPNRCIFLFYSSIGPPIPFFVCRRRHFPTYLGIPPVPTHTPMR